MRLDSKVRRCIVFLGHADPDRDESFSAAGTGFFVDWQGMRYLVTAQHVAIGLGEGPYCVRVNKTDGTSDNVFSDPDQEPLLRWLMHSDPSVDLAVAPWQFDFESQGYEALSLSGSILLSERRLSELDICAGDLCHAIGLFRLLQGSKRNIPLVHTGNLALMAGEELVPVDDWRQPRRGKTMLVRGHLVQMQNLKGLSGAPVLVRSGMEVVAPAFKRGPPMDVGRRLAVATYNADLYVLGVWSASWDAPPDQIASLEYGSSGRMPIGFGTVVPASRLIELLESPEAAERRAMWNSEAEAQITEREIAKREAGKRLKRDQSRRRKSRRRP